MGKRIAYRGTIFSFKQTATLATVPKHKTDPMDEVIYLEDGVLVVQDNAIECVADYVDIKYKLNDVEWVDYRGKLITPGFIDTHIHATQSGIIAAYGEKLLEWLNNYAFPTERGYVDADVARADLNFFLDRLIENGTTTACAYGPLFYEAADIMFEEAAKRGMRFIAGNVLMDVNSPDYLSLSVDQNYENCQRLIEKWHDHERLSYCLTPRFALTCSDQLMSLCGELKKAYPSIYLQTHLNENVNEIEMAKKLFPWSKHYLDIYDHFGLLTEQSIFAHCIHMTDVELNRFAETKAIAAWCPVSNNFLGSGLFNIEKMLQATDRITLGTDVGGGSSFSMFRVLDDAYKVAMLQNFKLYSMVRWYMATLGAAKSLSLDDKIGSFAAGNEADFIVIDPENSPIIKYRLDREDDVFELLFILMTLADDRQIVATYVNGKCLCKKSMGG